MRQRSQETQVADGKVAWSKKIGQQQQNFSAGPQKFESDDNQISLITPKEQNWV